MELERFSIVFILVVTGFTGMVSSLCLVRSTSTPKVYWYQCFMSDDYLADVNKAPIDIQRLTFTRSETRVVRNGSFTRLNNHLERLAFFYSDVEEIEDNAFRGLTKLDLLSFIGNKLRVIKSTWFEGLSNLKTVSFQNNQIKHIDERFFSILPPLETLDISYNDIMCLPTGSFAKFKTGLLRFRYNPLTWKCQVLLMNWIRETNTVLYDYENMAAPYNLIKMCIRTSPGDELDEALMKNCIEKTTRELLLTDENYTVRELCENLKDTPSPFLNCTGTKSRSNRLYKRSRPNLMEIGFL